MIIVPALVTGVTTMASFPGPAFHCLQFIHTWGEAGNKAMLLTGEEISDSKRLSTTSALVAFMHVHKFVA